MIKHSGKDDFGEDVYYTSLLRPGQSRVYVAEPQSQDTLTVMPMVRTMVFDTSNKLFLPLFSKAYIPRRNYYKPSFDVDGQTIPFKFRPSVAGFPKQLNANYNGVLYLGYRTDAYHVSYHSNHQGAYNRRISHIGFSLGAFSGIGATAVNEWVTRGRVTDQYDGFIWMTGLSAIFAVNNLSAGVGLGYDYLTDKNKDLWIYQGRHWVGLMVGLNLN